MKDRTKVNFLYINFTPPNFYVFFFYSQICCFQWNRIKGIKLRRICLLQLPQYTRCCSTRGRKRVSLVLRLLFWLKFFIDLFVVFSIFSIFLQRWLSILAIMYVHIPRYVNILHQIKRLFRGCQ